MGVQITELLTKKDIALDSLSGKVVAVDAHLFLYQFLTTIRQPDGSLLTDTDGRITSHLVGLFSRTANLMKKGIKLCYVFDGTAPELKQYERDQRKEKKMVAQKQYEQAKKAEDTEAMKKYASRTTRLTAPMIQESKELIGAFGLPIVQAPSEGEAQAAHLAKKGDAFCVASQDADSLLFGTPRLVRNVSVAGKRKKTNKLAYETIQPELIELSANLNHLGVDQKKLIALSMLVGTDYNPGGIKGLGAKKALALVKKYDDFKQLFAEAKWDDFCDTSWEEIYDLFTHMPVSDDYELQWQPANKEAITQLLVDDHNFSPDRVLKGIDTLVKEQGKMQQKGLQEFFG